MLYACEEPEEIAFLLEHRDGNVTRAVYVREVADVRRRAMRRSRLAAELADALRAGSRLTAGEDIRPDATGTTDRLEKVGGRRLRRPTYV